MDKRIGITIGDPCGVGPEIVASTIAALDPATQRRLIVYCDRSILERAFAQAVGELIPAGVCLVDRGRISPDQVPLGVPTLAGAVAQLSYLEAAAQSAQRGEIAGMVTAPISKQQVAQTGWSFHGHTDFLAKRLHAQKVAMMFAGPRLKVALASVHVALRAVPSVLTQKRIEDVISLCVASLQSDFSVKIPRIGVVGLNPHAGENGLMGTEESELIAPAIEECRRQLSGSADVMGPVVPDAAFRLAIQGNYDALVAMYHDQALIPVKLVDFERSVNMTLGLPIVRTSPDHGVAYDIAGKGVARASSFQAALKLALDLVDR